MLKRIKERLRISPFLHKQVSSANAAAEDEASLPRSNVDATTSSQCTTNLASPFVTRSKLRWRHLQKSMATLNPSLLTTETDELSSSRQNAVPWSQFDLSDANKSQFRDFSPTPANFPGGQGEAELCGPSHCGLGVGKRDDEPLGATRESTQLSGQQSSSGAVMKYDGNGESEDTLMHSDLVRFNSSINAKSTTAPARYNDMPSSEEEDTFLNSLSAALEMLCENDQPMSPPRPHVPSPLLTEEARWFEPVWIYMNTVANNVFQDLSCASKYFKWKNVDINFPILIPFASIKVMSTYGT